LSQPGRPIAKAIVDIVTQEGFDKEGESSKSLFLRVGSRRHGGKDQRSGGCALSAREISGRFLSWRATATNPQ
jgi:hypothetical protein